ncbi:Sac2 family-domain-containing protein [Scheffersomyces coipomensis]|uniref:Sac2 family-domain-containing protein n=1 Tax=Scheffersomyces coipomensis TaxID=1788519 RepID=UPI00315DA209
MSGLETLKQILTSKDHLADAPIVESLVNLESLLSKQSGGEGNNKATLLDSFRTHANALNASRVNQLNINDLAALVDKFDDYNDKIQQFQSKLDPIEKILDGFNQDLSHLSASLVSLQEKSTKLSSDSNIQHTVTEKLNGIILDLMISPEVAKSVVEDEIDEKWLENLRFINEKSQLIHSIKSKKMSSELEQLYNESRALEQLELGIKLLSNKAVERIRDFLISNVKQLRSLSKTSSQEIQQKLIKLKEIFVFLNTQHPELAAQLRLAYIYTMRWYYQTKFAKYIYALEKLHIRHIDQNFVLGTDGEKKQSVFGTAWKGWLPTGTNLTTSYTTAPTSHLSMNEYLASMDKRIHVLDDSKAGSRHVSAIPSQIAETTPFVYWLEFVYNQFAVALTDNIVVEYLFMVEFFYQDNEKFDKIDLPKLEDDNLSTNAKGVTGQVEWYQIMFNDIFKMGREFVTWAITHYPYAKTIGGSAASAARVHPSASFGSCDGYAILVIIRLVQASQSIFQNKYHIPIMNDYLNSLLLILWPQFTKIIDLNCEAMKKMILQSSKVSTLAPVHVTQQFAQYISGLLKLSGPIADDNSTKDYRGEPLYNSIVRLRNDFESYLTKLSTHSFGNSKNKQVEKEIFLYNNYFLIVNILKNENSDVISNSIVEEQLSHFELLCEAYKKTTK